MELEEMGGPSSGPPARGLRHPESRQRLASLRKRMGRGKSRDGAQKAWWGQGLGSSKCQIKE